MSVGMEGGILDSTGPQMGGQVLSPATGPGPLPQNLAVRLIGLRHTEYDERARRWQLLMDTLEGGERYRNATYGPDWQGHPAHNLYRHRSEYPAPQITTSPYTASMYFTTSYAEGVREDQGKWQSFDTYELRRARTPVPGALSEAVYEHRDRIFAREVRRTADGYPKIKSWWDDVDGAGSNMDRWIRDVFAPLFFVLGQLDVLALPPDPPGDYDPATMADFESQGLDRCHLSIILPTNVPWWYMPDRQTYQEVLIKEYSYDYAGGSVCKYRHWTKYGWALYLEDGRLDTLPDGRAAWGTNPFGAVPVRRLFASKLIRSENLGRSEYEGIAENVREIYNRSSELILSDVLQSAPTLQGPEEYISGSGTIQVGADRVLPMTAEGKGWNYVTPDKAPDESLRKNIYDLNAQNDRAAGLAKPAGEATGTGSVPQISGISKMMDRDKLSNILVTRAQSLQAAELSLCEMAQICITRRPVPPDFRAKVKVIYPERFNLFSLGDLLAYYSDFLAILESPAVAALPESAKDMLLTMLREQLPAQDDARYETVYASEIKIYIDSLKEEIDAQGTGPAVPKQVPVALHPRADGGTPPGAPGAVGARIPTPPGVTNGRTNPA